MMNRPSARRRTGWHSLAAGLSLAIAASAGLALAATQGGPLPGPLPLFPSTNWWNADVSLAPVDANSASYISFIGPTRTLHPDFGGEVYPGSVETYGMPYVVVRSSQPKRAVEFDYAGESDGVDHSTGLSFPFYPVPDEAITQPHWIEGGQPGQENPGGDRHMLIVDSDNRYLYELYALRWDGSRWTAGSGAFFDMKTNNRRPDGWTSTDAAGLAILPGLVRHDEVYGTGEIGHAFRVTVRATNGYVYPASHRAGSTAGALPMGARLRLKASKDISGFPPEVQRIFRSMKRHGLIVADNGSDMYVGGTFDTRWDNDVLNPAFAALRASDFEVVQLGWKPLPPAPAGLANRFRLYSDVTKEHLYTTDTNEYNVLGMQGWAQEGVAHRVYTTNAPVYGLTPVPLYRVHHPGIHQHLWTTDPNEYAVLGAGAWTQEGIDGYLLPSPVAGVTVPLYRLAYRFLPIHLWTTDTNEYSVLNTQGWVQEGVVGHVVP